MAERKQNRSHAKPPLGKLRAGERREERATENGLPRPSRKLYGTRDAKDPVRVAFYQEIAEILRTARAKAYRASNFLMVEAYWNIGRMIVEEERQNKGRSRYGERLMVELSARLTPEFGTGYGKTNLFWMRQFFMSYPIFHTVCGKFITSSGADGCGLSSVLRSELSWSHYRLLLRVDKPEARAWYMNEAAEQNWSVRALERQIGSLFFASQYRLVLPTEEELRREIERERNLAVREQEARYG